MGTPKALNPQRPPRLRLWHTTCILLSSLGCLYPFPPIFVEDNYPPEQKSVQPLPSQTVTLAASGTVFFVTVGDPEGDRVDFTWSTTQAYLGPGTPIQGGEGIVGSQVTLLADSVYDGQKLECTYVDDPADQSIQHEPVTLSWTLSVPAQEAP